MSSDNLSALLLALYRFSPTSLRGVISRTIKPVDPCSGLHALANWGFVTCSKVRPRSSNMARFEFEFEEDTMLKAFLFSVIFK
jgi:hypothetical protein